LFLFVLLFFSEVQYWYDLAIYRLNVQVLMIQSFFDQLVRVLILDITCCIM